MLFSRWTLRAAAWPLLIAAAAGCRPQDEITQYTVPKPHLVDGTLASAPGQPSEQQMLAAVVLVKDAGWFFKLTADKAAAGTLEKPFIDFMTSLKFTGGPQPEPKWELPEGWKQLPGNQFRFATIEVPGPDKPLELTVTTLPKQEDDDEAYVLANVNRWREQLQLPALEPEELRSKDNSISLKVDGYPCTLINIVGQGTGRMAAGPFAGGMPPVASTNEGSGRKAPELAFKEPEGWTKAPPKIFSLATFTAGTGDKQAEITVSAAGGDLLANVNRWRGQIGLPPVDQEQLAKELAKIETLGTSGDYVQLVGPSKTIFGVVATVGGTQYFIKLTGDSETAELQKANFESFVKSLQLQ